MTALSFMMIPSLMRTYILALLWAEHRQNLHELIVGAQGVALANTFDALTDTISTLTSEIRDKANAIPVSARGTMPVDTFCALATRQDIDSAIRNAERALAAVNESEPVRTTAMFPSITLPAVDFAALAVQRN